MSFALVRWLRLVLLRRTRRGCCVLLGRTLRRTVYPRLLLRLRTRRGSSVLRRLRTRSVMHLRRRSMVLRGFRSRSVMLLRRRPIVYRGVGPLRRNIMTGRLRNCPIVCLRTRPRLLVYMRSRGGFVCRSVWMRSVLRRSRLLIVFRRMRNLIALRRTRNVFRTSLLFLRRRTSSAFRSARRLVICRRLGVVGMRSLRRPVYLGQSRVHCIRRSQSSRLRGSHDCGTSLVMGYKLSLDP